MHFTRNALGSATGFQDLARHGNIARLSSQVWGAFMALQRHIRGLDIVYALFVIKLSMCDAVPWRIRVGQLLLPAVRPFLIGHVRLVSFGNLGCAAPRASRTDAQHMTPTHPDVRVRSVPRVMGDVAHWTGHHPDDGVRRGMGAAPLTVAISIKGTASDTDPTERRNHALDEV